MHCTVAFLVEYPLLDSFELKAFMLTSFYIVFGLKKPTNPLPELLFEKKLC